MHPVLYILVFLIPCGLILALMVWPSIDIHLRWKEYDKALKRLKQEMGWEDN